jgi:hypothetical protein
MASTGGPEYFILLILIFVIPFWQIIKKSGRPGVWALVAFVPLVNLVLLYVFAFSEWPIQRQVRELSSPPPEA